MANPTEDKNTEDDGSKGSPANAEPNEQKPTEKGANTDNKKKNTPNKPQAPKKPVVHGSATSGHLKGQTVGTDQDYMVNMKNAADLEKCFWKEIEASKSDVDRLIFKEYENGKMIKIEGTLAGAAAKLITIPKPSEWMVPKEGSTSGEMEVCETTKELVMAGHKKVVEKTALDLKDLGPTRQHHFMRAFNQLTDNLQEGVKARKSDEDGVKSYDDMKKEGDIMQLFVAIREVLSNMQGKTKEQKAQQGIRDLVKTSQGGNSFPLFMEEIDQKYEVMLATNGIVLSGSILVIVVNNLKKKSGEYKQDHHRSLQ